jgi:hypothetical protein
LRIFIFFNSFSMMLSHWFFFFHSLKYTYSSLGQLSSHLLKKHTIIWHSWTAENKISW